MPVRKRMEIAPTAAGIKRGDQVRVMTGRDRGKTGRVLAVNPGTRTVMVEHAGMIKRHTRPNPSKNVKGGIVETYPFLTKPSQKVSTFSASGLLRV